MTLKLFKLTDQQMQTRNNFQWKIGEERCAFGGGHQGFAEDSMDFRLCSPDYLHFYEHPIVALVMNARHASFLNPRMFLALGQEEHCKRDGFAKIGVRNAVLLREVPLPHYPNVDQEREIFRRILATLYPESRYPEDTIIHAAVKRFVSGNDNREDWKSIRAIINFRIDTYVHDVEEGRLFKYTDLYPLYSAYLQSFEGVCNHLDYDSPEFRVDLFKIIDEVIPPSEYGGPFDFSLPPQENIDPVV